MGDTGGKLYLGVLNYELLSFFFTDYPYVLQRTNNSCCYVSSTIEHLDFYCFGIHV